MIDDDNPYAAPKAEVLLKDRHLDSSSDACRDGKLLVVRKGAELTDRCLKCAVPTKGYRERFSRLLSWHKPHWFVLFFFNWLLYVMAYFFVRWQGRVTVALCARNRKNRARAIALGWFAALAGVGLMIFAGMSSDIGRISGSHLEIAVATGIVLVLGGLIGGMVGSQVLVARRIDKNLIWLGKVSPDYLATLQDWNAHGDEFR